MKQTSKEYLEKFAAWLLNASRESEEVKDEELEALRIQTRQEFIQMRDRGLPIRIVSL